MNGFWTTITSWKLFQFKEVDRIGSNLRDVGDRYARRIYQGIHRDVAMFDYFFL